MGSSRRWAQWQRACAPGEEGLFLSDHHWVFCHLLITPSPSLCLLLMDHFLVHISFEDANLSMWQLHAPQRTRQIASGPQVCPQQSSNLSNCQGILSLSIWPERGISEPSFSLKGSLPVPSSMFFIFSLPRLGISLLLQLHLVSMVSALILIMVWWQRWFSIRLCNACTYCQPISHQCTVGNHHYEG